MVILNVGDPHVNLCLAVLMYAKKDCEKGTYRWYKYDLWYDYLEEFKDPGNNVSVDDIAEWVGEWMYNEARRPK